jgi:osmotically-inducible protein OsmY
VALVLLAELAGSIWFQGRAVIDFSSLTEAANARLREAAYRPVQAVNCECDDGVLYLYGRVPSFYCKQLAQEAVVRLPGVGNVVNRIEVVPVSR